MFFKNIFALAAVLAPALCQSEDTSDIWIEICELYQSKHPDDSESDIYKIACDEDNEGCQATLDSSYWEVTCDDRGFAMKSMINEKEELSTERHLRSKKRYYVRPAVGGGYGDSMLGYSTLTITSISAVFVALTF